MMFSTIAGTPAGAAAIRGHLEQRHQHVGKQPTKMTGRDMPHRTRAARSAADDSGRIPIWRHDSARVSTTSSRISRT